MEAKEKAIELVERYSFLEPEEAKQCANICVDEIIEALEHHAWQNRNYIDYYNEVKQEINKL
jgi:predicted RNA-binding protein with EMAP domain